MRKYLFISVVVIALTCPAFAYWRGWWIPNEPNLTAYPVRGIDVSHHQGQIDWKAVASDGINFAFIKASEGGDFQDDRFQENLRKATQAGLPCGAYHFFTLKASGHSQAQNFIHTVPGDMLRLPPVIDLETWGDTSPSSIQEFQLELSSFMAELRKAYGTEPIIYTSSDYMQVYLKDYSIKRLWFRSVLFTPDSYGVSHLEFWQFTEKERVVGIEGFVDMDVFNGSKADFEAQLIKTSRINQP